MSRSTPAIPGASGGAPSARVLQVCATFGLKPPATTEEAAAPEAVAARIAQSVLGELKPGRIALISGPSGSGKSLAVRAVAAVLRDRAAHADQLLAGLLEHDGPVIDALCTLPGKPAAPVDTVLRGLSLAGLAEPRLWLRPARTFSTGEQARLGIAASVLAADQRAGSVVLIDEFTSLLDDTTAANVARTLRRWIGPGKPAVLCASSREQAGRWLRPDAHWELTL